MLKHKQPIFLAVIIMMSASGLFATDIYLPALPQMISDFNCSKDEIQASFTVFLLGLAGCQFLTGILADHFGGKRMTLIGLSLCGFASLLCVFAQTLNQFLLLRLLQAIGCGVGSVISRAMVASRYEREEAVKIFATVFPIVGLSVAVAPLVGGYLTYFFQWRATFIFMTLFSLVAFILVLLYLEESTKEKNTMSVTPLKTVPGIKDYLSVIKNMEYLGYVILVCAAYCVFRSYTAESPFIFNSQGYLTEEIGHFYITLSIAYIVGNLLAKKLVKRMKLKTVLRMGLGFFILGAISMIITSWCAVGTAYAVIIPMSIITVGNGCLFPVGSAGALAAVNKKYTGTASGFMGTAQFVLGALCISLIGGCCEGDSLKLSLFIGGIISFAILSHVLLTGFRAKVAIETP
jgi:DHA1 family bicyclomycin/chloramphenicol resistance-like MFS transporter